MKQVATLIDSTYLPASTRMLAVPEAVAWRRRIEVLRLLFGFPGSAALVQTCTQDRTRKATLSNNNVPQTMQCCWDWHRDGEGA